MAQLKLEFVIQIHLKDEKTGKFLAYDRHGEDELLLVDYGEAFMLSFDTEMQDAMISTAKRWGRMVIACPSVNGKLCRCEP